MYDVIGGTMPYIDNFLFNYSSEELWGITKGQVDNDNNNNNNNKDKKATFK